MRRLLLSGFCTGGSLATPLDVLYVQNSSKKGGGNYFRTQQRNVGCLALILCRESVLPLVLLSAAIQRIKFLWNQQDQPLGTLVTTQLPIFWNCNLKCEPILDTLTCFIRS